MKRIRWVAAVSVATVLLTGFLGCTSWRKQDASLDQLLAKRPGIVVRVLVEGQSVPIQLSGARIEADTLYGWGRYIRDRKSKPPSPADWDWRYRKQPKKPKADSLAIPLTVIRSVETRQFSAAKTVILVLGIGATAALVAAAIALASWEGISFGDGGGGGGGGYSGSCPLIYSWDGALWQLDSGTYAGAIMPALARTDVDVLEHAAAAQGELRLRLTGLSDETEHVDALSIQAVDHPRGTFIAPDEKGGLHVLAEAAPPLSARDFRGGDALDRIRERDGWGWESSLSGRVPGLDDDVRDGIEVEFAKPDGGRAVFLEVDAKNTPWAAYLIRRFVGLHGDGAQQWYDAIAADPGERAALVTGFVRETFLRVSIWNGASWADQGFLPEVGPEAGKRQVLAIDPDHAPGDRVRVRMESAAALWNIDRVRLAVGAGGEPAPRDALILSARDRDGHPVDSALRAAGDGEEYVIRPGDAAELRFQAPQAPRDGRVRTYVARTTGWYEIHAAGTGAPDTKLAARLIHEPLAASRFSVEEMNAALNALSRLARTP